MVKPGKDYQPVIIIGAPRSGTNMLRDVLTAIDGVNTWPCDEINYIWRYGQASNPVDEFTAEDVNKKNKTYIRKQFNKLQRKTGSDYVVEKTCANSLRVDFVEEIIPEARYIFLFRNPVDVVTSARKRWKASLDLLYILKKARFVPLKDVPYYAVKYLWNRVYKLFSSQERLAFWGPKFKGMYEELDRESSVERICALQWKKCAETSLQVLRNLNRDRVHAVAYENFVFNPENKLKRMLDWMEINKDDLDVSSLVADVSTASVEKGYDKLDEETIAMVEDITWNVYEEIIEEFDREVKTYGSS